MFFYRTIAFVVVAISLGVAIKPTQAYVPNLQRKRTSTRDHSCLTRPERIQHPSLPMATGDEEYSLDVRLREEAESPFRKVRYYFYILAAGGASTSLAISVARIAAALAGVNTDLMDESLRNAAVDVAGLAVAGLLYKRDIDAEQSRLKRATRGAVVAKLSVRANKKLMLGEEYEDDEPSTTFTTTLASLRQGRGIEKRVLIAAAGSERIARVLEEAKELQEDMYVNDLVVVPIVMPRGVAPEYDDDLPACVATPVSVGTNWKDYVDDEAAEAIKQGVDIDKEGICIILKKNGRVGQRTRGIFLGNLVGNVVARREAGMDTTNI